LGKKKKGKRLDLKARIPNIAKPITAPQVNRPLFCFKFLNKGDHGISKERGRNALLLKRLVHYSRMTWADIKANPRHKSGLEYIPVNHVKATPPSEMLISNDQEYCVLRGSGKMAILGIKRDNIFHILFIDWSFNLYSHS